MTSSIPNWTRIWVRGRFVDLAKASTGAQNYGLVKPVIFAPAATVILDSGTGQIIQSAQFSVTPRPTDGYFAIQLPATDDPDLNPTNFTYAVTEPTGRKYNMVVPIDTPVLSATGDPLDGEQVIDLISVAPAPSPSTGTVQLLSYAQLPDKPTHLVGRMFYASGTYPARPSGYASIEWVGPVAPTTGGSGAVDGVDTWLDTSA